jgi:hypothetical protein
MLLTKNLRLCFTLSIWRVTVYRRLALISVSHNLQGSSNSLRKNTLSSNSITI